MSPAFYERFTPVRRGELRVTVLLCAYLFSIVAATVAAKSARDALFLGLYGPRLLPLVLAAVAGCAALAAFLHSRVMRRLRFRRTTQATTSLFLATLPLLAPQLDGPLVAFFYIWVEVIAVVTMLQFWQLAAELCDAHQARRLFPFIAGAASLGAIAAGAPLPWFVRTFGVLALLAPLAGFLVVSLACALTLDRLPRIAVGSPRPERFSAAAPRVDIYLVLLGVLIACTAIISPLVDYQFKTAAAGAYATPAALAAFFGLFHALTGAATLVLQSVFTARVFASFGLPAGLLLLPFALVAGALAILAAPGFLVFAASRFSDQAFKFTLYNSSLEMLWLPVPPWRRASRKPLLNGALRAATEALSAVAVFLLALLLPLHQLSWVTLGVGAVWLVAVFRARPLYLATLEAALARRRLDWSGILATGSALPAGPPPAEVDSLIQQAAYARATRAGLLPLPAAPLLHDYWAQRFHGAVRELLRLAASTVPGAPVAACLYIWDRQDPARLPFLSELLDFALTRRQRAAVAALLEARPVPGDHSARPPQLANPWVDALERYYANPESVEEPMRDLIDRTTLLKQVPLFSSLPAEQLAHVASIAAPVALPAGATLFRDGDPASSLYLIVSGAVRIEKSAQELACLASGECLGEMAVLDPAPRSATAVALEDSQLIEIMQDDFRELLAAQPELSAGVLQMLVRRLRETSERIQQHSA